MLLYATVIPYKALESENYNFSQEVLQVLIASVEIVFILWALREKNNFMEREIHLKIIALSLAWSLAESLFSYLLYFFMNAIAEEFKWEYIQTSIIANIDLVNFFKY